VVTPMRLINSDGQVTDARVIAQDGGNAASASIGNSVLLLPILIAITCLSMLIAGISLGFALKASADADAARRQARASEMRVEGFTRALIAHNIDPYPHVKGENP
jgi:hypothetical protein